MSKKTLIVFVLMILGSLPLFAQHAEELYSPFFFGQGPLVTSLDAPVAAVFNPAAAGLEQRTRLELNYSALFGTAQEPGWGNAVNLGLSIPSNFGVFSFNGHFISSPFPSSTIGTLGGLSIAFSKDLYSNFLIGIGVNSLIGEQAGIVDWSLGADVGVIHNLGNVLFFQDFTWGLACRNMGKGYEPSASINYFPQAFTPALGLGFKLVKTDAFAWGFNIDLSAPKFNSLVLYAATDISILKTLLIRTNFHFDFAELASPVGRFPLSFGLSLNFSLDVGEKVEFLGISEKGWNKSDIRIDTAFAPLQNGIYAAGLGINLALGSIDKTPPQVSTAPVKVSGDTATVLEPEETAYISPNLDGTQDNLELKTEIKDERYVKGYKLIIKDSAGKVVRVIENKEERPENVDIDNVLNRFIYVKSGIKVPETLRWDGKSDAGTIVNDGEYSYSIEAWDDNGNRVTTPEKKVVVDKTPPSATTQAAYTIFSPNGDGNKDVLPLSLSGSAEDDWKGVVSDAQGQEVAHFEWKGKSPESLSWDGTNDSGELVPDGVYTFSLASTDRAGNTALNKIDNIIINTVSTPITMTINTAFFSPNSDGVKDSVVISLSVPVTANIESWSLTITNAKKKAVRVFSGKETIFSSFTFEGKSDSGSLLPEGTYKASLDVRYNNGNNPTAESPEITLDLTPPAIKLSFDNPVFSPNNDGNKDNVTISMDTSEEDEWVATVTDAKTGIVKKNYRWKGKPESRLVWGGQSDEGTLLPDGGYHFVLASTDRAGNSSKSVVQPLTINTEETPVLFTATLTHFSPNNDRINDTITLIPQLKVTSGIDTYTVQIKDKAGKTAKTFTGAKQAPISLAWDGSTDAGGTAPDGEYTAVLNMLYINGNNPTAKTSPFFIDVKAPEIVLTPEYTLFSPDGDGLKDTLLVAQKSSLEDLWEGRVTDKNGRTVKSFYWKGATERLAWDGRDDNGNKLADGYYTYSIAATDKAGNSAQTELKGIEINVTPTPVFITADAAGFSPNNDKTLDAFNLNLYVENKKGIKSWSLELVHDKKGVQRVFKGAADVPEKITWDGIADNRQAAAEGVYTGVLTVEYNKGNKPVEKTTPFRLDVSAPEVDFKMNPLPFSPDNDGVDDELAIGIKVQDASPIRQWKLEIRDPTGVRFITFQGSGTPTEKILWDGLSDKGELVQAASDYKLEFSITDDVGNKKTLEKIIPVDVLVMRDGDKLYVRVPSITFKPDTANYTDVAKEALDKNMWTLDRLAQIFKKYRTYNILIEGHAVSVWWRDPARSAKEQVEELIPLSKSRAEAIKQALISKGIEANRISTEGVGASRPIIPFSDEENLWKNRRVEFILLKK